LSTGKSYHFMGLCAHAARVAASAAPYTLCFTE
jgi:hypothetical protein